MSDSKYVDVCDCDYGDYIYYNGSTWVVDETNYSKGTVTIRDLGGHTYKEIDRFTTVELDN